MWQWLASTVLAPITSIVDGWQKRKTAELESDLAIHKAQTDAKIKLVQNAQDADIAWENLSIQKSGWKDEWFTIVLSIPLVMCFVPGLDVYVRAGFASLSANTPEWYTWMVSIAVASSFGYKKIADFMALKKGS